MANYAKVDVRIWNDRKVRQLSPIPPCGQGLWVHLLVSEHRTSLPGVLKVGEAALAEELGWSLEAFRKAFREAEELGMVKADWKARFVWIPNACRYNPPESPNVVKSWRVPWDEAPECDLKDEAYSRLKALLEGFDKSFQEAFAKACPEPLANQEHEQEQEHEHDPDSDCGETDHPELTDRGTQPSLLPPEPALLTFPCDGKQRSWDLAQANVQAILAAFPTLDVEGECRKALLWIQSNPDKRKTAKGMMQFLFNWMSNAQNRGPSRRPAQSAADQSHGRVAAKSEQTVVGGGVDL